jgi:hypothetical protein
MKKYSIASPQNYVVNIRVGDNTYEEAFEIKATLY